MFLNFVKSHLFSITYFIFELQETEQKRKRVFLIKNYEKKFIKKIRRAYFETKRLQPDNTQRELESVCQYSSLFGHILNKYNNKKA